MAYTLSSSALLALSVSATLLAASCGKDDDGGGDSDTGGTDAAADAGGTDAAADTGTDAPADTGGGESFAPDTILGLSITFEETGIVTNTWTFDTATDATLVGTGTFPYTFTRTDDTHTVVEFDVGGTDRYDMTWTSSAGGTFEESFDGTPGTTGTFTAN